MPHILNIEDPAEFVAEVYNDRGEPVYHIHGREIIRSGVMHDERDVDGLTRHLRRLKRISLDDSIILERRTKRRSS